MSDDDTKAQMAREIILTQRMRIEELEEPFKNHDDRDWEWLDKNLPRDSIQAEFWHNTMRKFYKALKGNADE